jgi:hypothetical protein
MRQSRLLEMRHPHARRVSVQTMHQYPVRGLLQRDLVGPCDRRGRRHDCVHHRWRTCLGDWELFWLAIIFYAPAAGGVIAEIIRWSIQRRRAKYIWLVACASFVIGAFLAGGALPFILIALTAIGNPRMLGSIALSGIFGFLFNIGLWIYIIMGVGTVYVRLKN